MTSMVAKACSSTSSQMPSMTVQEKGSRNKRKYRADPPLFDPSNPILLSSNECSSFEFSAEKFETHHGHTNGFDLCCLNQDTPYSLKLDLGLSCPVGPSEAGCPRQEIATSADGFHDADWSDHTETELEQLVLSNLDTIIKSAIKKIIASGYSERVATKAILRSGLWYGCLDTVSNVVNNTLAFLTSGQEIDPSREHYFEDLQQMEKYILAELVCLLREVRPFFSTGDAMWCLLICDMNVSHACAMDSGPSSCFLGDAPSNTSSSISVQSQSKTAKKKSESNIVVPRKLNSLIDCAENCPSESPEVSKTKSSCAPNNFVQDESGINKKPFSAIPETEQKFIGSRKVPGITKREYILRQKSMHFEKRYRAYGSKAALRTRKLNAFSGLVLDKKLKGVADSTRNKAIGFDVPPENANSNILSTTGFTSVPTFGVDTVDKSSTSPKSNKISSTSPPVPVDTKLSLSFSGDKSFGQSAILDKKDGMIIKLVPRVRELENQLQEWTEWANQKVMQAARRLGKDKAELKTIRKEKEEVDRLKKEKQALEESTMKKLSEMEHALCKASGQMERANGAVRRLEVENVVLRRDMEAAKLQAAQSDASCQEVSKREKKTTMKSQSWEKQKSVFREELSTEKLKLVQMQQKLKHAKDVRDQVQAKLNEEEKAKDELLIQAGSLRKEREQIEVSTQSKEDTIKSQAQANLHKYKDDIRKLEKEISQLRLKTDSSKIAALRRGIDGSYASKTDLKYTTTTSHNDSAICYISKNMMITTNLKDSKGVKRERECVMCLSEEMSVVFLPCAHQVVCTTCNELHEKQGMKDCPSCRSPIQRRVCVRYAHP